MQYTEFLHAIAKESYAWPIVNAKILQNVMQC